MTEELTERQRRVLDAVRRTGADGWPVTVREIQAELGYASTQSVHEALIDLERAGLIETNPRVASRRGGWRPVA